jgi:hypothetical protein
MNKHVQDSEYLDTTYWSQRSRQWTWTGLGLYMKLLGKRCMFCLDFVAFVASKLCKTCGTNQVVEHLTVWAPASLRLFQPGEA